MVGAMAIRKITLIGEDVLRQKARKVTQFDAQLHKLLDDMVDTLLDAPGVGPSMPRMAQAS